MFSNTSPTMSTNTGGAAYPSTDSPSHLGREVLDVACIPHAGGPLFPTDYYLWIDIGYHRFGALSFLATLLGAIIRAKACWRGRGISTQGGSRQSVFSPTRLQTAPPRHQVTS